MDKNMAKESTPGLMGLDMRVSTKMISEMATVFMNGLMASAMRVSGRTGKCMDLV